MTMASFAAVKTIIVNAPIDKLDELLQNHDLDINIKDTEGKSLAADCELDADKLAWLLENGLDPNMQDNDGNTFMRCPDEYGVEKIMKIFETKTFKIKFNPNIKNKKGKTFLWHWGNSKCCEQFLKYSVNKLPDNLTEIYNINNVDNNHNTILHTCTNENKVKVFINYNANLNIKNKEGRTPLDIAIRYKRPISLLKLLRFNFEGTLMRQINYDLASSLVRNLDETTIRYLFEKNALKDDGYHTLLEGQSFEKTKLLMEIGLDPNVVNSDGAIPFEYTGIDLEKLFKESTFKVKFNPNNILNINHYNRVFRPLLKVCALSLITSNTSDNTSNTSDNTSNFSEIFDINRKDKNQRTYLDKAIVYGCQDLICLLVSNGATIDDHQLNMLRPSTRIELLKILGKEQKLKDEIHSLRQQLAQRDAQLQKLKDIIAPF